MSDPFLLVAVAIIGVWLAVLSWDVSRLRRKLNDLSR